MSTLNSDSQNENLPRSTEKSPPFLHQRRIFLSKQQLQFRCLLWLLGSIALVVLLVAVNLYFAWKKLLIFSIFSETSFEVVAQSTLHLWLELTALIVALSTLTLWISNRLAGPLFRMERVVQQVGKGDFTPSLQLRRDDELLETAEYINAMIHSLEDYVHRDRNLAIRISTKLKDLAQRLQERQISSGETVTAINDLLPELHHISSAYKTKDSDQHSISFQ